MLTRLYADNYRCFVNFEFRPSSLQLILGPNGSGKSTLFEVLCLLRDFCARGLACEDRFLGTTLTRWQEAGCQQFELDVKGFGGEYTFRLCVDSWGSPARPRVLEEAVCFDNQPIFRFKQGEMHLYNDRHEDKVQYPSDWHRSGLALVVGRKDNQKLTWFKQWLSDLLCLRIDPFRMSSLAAKEASHPREDLTNLAEWYRHLRLENDDRALVDDLRQVISGFDTLSLRDAGLGNRILTANMRPSGTHSEPAPYGLEELSDGQRVLIALYSVLHFVVGSERTLCLDEPDNFLCLREIQPWLLRLLDRVEASHAQVIVASHHPELLNQLASRGGQVLDRLEGGKVLARFFADPADTGLSPAELVSRGWERD